MKSISVRDLCRILEKKGWLLKKIYGSHDVYMKAGRTERISVPVHGNKDLEVGMLKAIMKIAEIEQNLKSGGNRIVIENGQIIRSEKNKSAIVKREVLTKNWVDWIDYWAVDFDYASKKEIISVGKGDAAKEVWTGNYIFENEWQSFRTKKNPNLELESSWHEYNTPLNPLLIEGKKARRYKIAVKVVDILGQDTTQVVEVKVS